jgi:hypothetical protein
MKDGRHHNCEKSYNLSLKCFYRSHRPLNSWGEVKAVPVIGDGRAVEQLSVVGHKFHAPTSITRSTN